MKSLLGSLVSFNLTAAETNIQVKQIGWQQDSCSRRNGKFNLAMSKRLVLLCDCSVSVLQQVPWHVSISSYGLGVNPKLLHGLYFYGDTVIFVQYSRLTYHTIIVSISFHDCMTWRKPGQPAHCRATFYKQWTCQQESLVAVHNISQQESQEPSYC